MKGTKELVKTERPRGWLSPINEMERWFEEAWTRPFSLFRSPFYTGRTAELEEISPSIDMYSEGNEVVVKADLPGVSKKDIKIDVEGNMLTISGERKHEEKVEREHYYSFERSYGRFFRTFDLPSDLDTNKVKAHYEDGVLEIRIPKSAEGVKKSKTISID